MLGSGGSRRARPSCRCITRRAMPRSTSARRWWSCGASVRRSPSSAPFQCLVRQGLSPGDDGGLPRRPCQHLRLPRRTTTRPWRWRGSWATARAGARRPSPTCNRIICSATASGGPARARSRPWLKTARCRFMVPIPKVHDLSVLNERLMARCLERLDALEQGAGNPSRAQGASPRARVLPMDYADKLPPSPWYIFAPPRATFSQTNIPALTARTMQISSGRLLPLIPVTQDVDRLFAFRARARFSDCVGRCAGTFGLGEVDFGCCQAGWRADIAAPD